MIKVCLDSFTNVSQVEWNEWKMVERSNSFLCSITSPNQQTVQSGVHSPKSGGRLGVMREGDTNLEAPS